MLSQKLFNILLILGIFGGHLLGVKSVYGLAFYDWETQELIRRIEITPKAVYWSENGELCCIATEDSYFILKYDEAAVARSRESKEGVSEDGYDEAFDVNIYFCILHKSESAQQFF